MTSRSLRVLYIIGSIGDGRAGTEKNLLTIIKHLDRSAFEPILITLQDCEYFRSGKFVCETHCWHLNSVFSPAVIAKRRALVEFMKQKQIDIVQTFFIEAHLVGGSAARKAGVKAIISSRRNLGYSYDFKERLLLRIANRYPHRFLANSKAVIEAISNIEGVSGDRFRVIHNGVEMKPPLSIERRAPELIVMVANLRPVKAIPVLIHAALPVVREIPRARFRIIGEGPERHHLQALVNSLGLKTNVEMPGSTNDVHAAISSATIGVLTSSSEGFSNSLLEYMRAGLPVIASDVGGNDEMVSDGVNGFLFPAGDSNKLAERILQLLREPQKAQELGQAGRRLVEERFSVDVMVRQHEAFYRSLVAETQVE